jgi:hypothetical protein
MIAIIRYVNNRVKFNVYSFTVAKLYEKRISSTLENLKNF